MPDLFLSYSHADLEPVSSIAEGLASSGHEVWWDRRLRANQDFGTEIEGALRKANCAIVAWSRTARDSLWVRAEATAAWDAGKLVQLSLDGAKPPLPFTVIHLLDYSEGARGIDGLAWRELQEAVDSVVNGDRSKIAPTGTPPGRFGGFGRAVVVGAASLALIIVAAGIVGIGVTGVLPPNVFGVVTGGMFLAALVSFAHMLIRVISVSQASR